MRKITCLALAIAFVFLAGCARDGQAEARPRYARYQDIPGVTAQEIEALDALFAQKPRLVYGVCVSTEAFLHDDGSVGGFAALLRDRMTELFGVEIVCVPYTWDEVLTKIAAGEVDLSGDFSPTPERRQTLIMSEPIIQRTIKIFTDTRGEDLGVTAKLRPLRCAFIQGSRTFDRVSESWQTDFIPIFIDDPALVPDLLSSGQIDAFIEEGVAEAAFDRHTYINADAFYPIIYSPISLATGNPELAPLIGVMQKYVDNGGAYELTELYNRGYREYLKHRLFAQLTDAQKAYIEAHGASGAAVAVGLESDNYPASFYNAKEAEFQGIAVDVLAQVSELTGLSLEIANRPDDSFSQLLEGLESGRYAIVSELIQSAQRQGRFLWPDTACFEDRYAMLSRIDFPEVDINQILFCKVGLLENTACTEDFLEWFPDSVNTQTFPNTTAAFAALESGEIDLLMATQSLLLHLVNYLEKPGFKANIVFNYASDSYLGFNRDEAMLRDIVSAALAYVDTAEIAMRWQQKSFDYQAKMARDMVPYLIFFVTALSAGLAAVLVLWIKNRRIGKNLERLVDARTRELALQTSTLTTMFESIPDLVFCKDLDLRFTRCNRSFEEYFGCVQADIVGKNDVDGLGIAPEMARAFQELDRQVIGQRRAMAVEESIPSADGTARFFETIKTPMTQDGRVIGIMSISRDITQRKTAEETLKLTLDNLDTCIYINEIDTGEILFINQRMVQEFGGQGDYVGQVCWKVLQDGFTEQCAFCPIPRLLESGDSYYIWEEHNTVTGRYYKNTDSLIRWHDGRLVHMQHSVDITESYTLQRELEHASKAKSDFLSRMSHEIRTPLGAIIGMNNIALSTDDLAKMRHCQERIDNASQHLLGLINDILDMSKIEADKFELSVAEFDFERTLMNITNVTNFRAEEKRQNLVVNLHDDVPLSLVGDELRLSQVITNLLTNAVKFTPEKGTIVLGIEKIGLEGDTVTLRFEVCDNGIGISEEQQARLFTSFEQADGSISRRFGGTGLGLAISKRIVELMGGQISIKSELGQGSTFTFTVRAKIGRAMARPKLTPTFRPEDIRILAVDDCPETRDYFAHVMQAHNLSFDLAAGGPEALEKIHACGDRPYNIFFVDWQMPEMDGIELTRRIKRIFGQNAVVIMISVADWNNIEAEAIQAGVRQFIPKPLFPSVLINTINECLGVQTQADEARASADREAGPCDLSGHTILIAEDIEINREIIAAVLEDTGLRIDFAEDGRAAVAMFEADTARYSLIFMDIHMPEMDGYEATRTIRALPLPRAREIPIVAMTANVFREDVETCLAAGMNDHVGKPVDQGEIFGILGRYLSGRPLSGAGPQD